MTSFKEKIKSFAKPFWSKEKSFPPLEDLLQNPEDAYRNSSEFYDKSDLIFFKQINAYGAFKYNVVKDILIHNEAITVSDVHLDLNGVYFSLDERRHQHNKRAAISNLGFLSKGLKYSGNEFTRYLYGYFLSNFPIEKPFNLVDYLINPLVFTNIMHEFGFLEFFPEFNPQSPHFLHEKAIEKIKSIFEDSTLIEPMLKTYLNNSGVVPEVMKHLVEEINVDNSVKVEQLPRFFASMIFASTHSTSSFLSSLVYTVANWYPNLLAAKPDYQQLHSIAEEVLRIYTPVPYIYRTVRKDVVYDGKNLRVGDTVILFIGAANLDPNYFSNPRQIMSTRTEKHLAFGKGQYACIGQSATFRLALNLLSYLSENKQQLTFLDKEETHVIHNAMLKIPIRVIFEKTKNRVYE